MTNPERERLAILVHEVRSPVAALAVIGEALRSDSVETSSFRDLVALAVAACSSIERLVEDATITSIRPQPIDAEELAHEIAVSACLGGARVRAAVDGTLPRLVGDPIRLRQALDNLVSNAIAVSPSGAEVVVTVHTSVGALLISVADEGPGIPPDEHEHIFEAGVRLDTSRPGSGIGLAVARAIIEAHDGHLTVESAPESGATFTVELPAG